MGRFGQAMPGLQKWRRPAPLHKTRLVMLRDAVPEMRRWPMIIARILWSVFYVLTLGVFTINSSDANMSFVGWPMVLSRWLKSRKRN